MVLSARRKDIEVLFEHRRIYFSKSILFLFPYFPIGMFIAILRFCLLLNFLVARQILGCFLHNDSLIFCLFTQLFMLILGVKVKVSGKTLPVDMVISNKRSNIDGPILCHSVGVFAENEWNMPMRLALMLNLCSRKRQSLAGKAPPIVVFPEKCATSGRGIAQFDATYFSGVASVQMATIKYWRPFPITASTLYSGFMSDLFWTFFNPITVVMISAYGDCIFRDESVSDHEFSATLATRMSEILKKPVLPITALDKAQYLKHLKTQATQNTSPTLVKMVERVHEVVPHVPKEVILADLRKTGSVDVTLTNIFEGIVEFVPIDPNSRPSQSGSTQSKKLPQTPFERRKAELLEMARARYKEKHGL